MRFAPPNAAEPPATQTRAPMTWAAMRPLDVSGTKYTRAGPAANRASPSAVRAPGVFLHSVTSIAESHICHQNASATDICIVSNRDVQGIKCTDLSDAAESRPKASALERRPDCSMNVSVRPFFSASDSRPACSALDSNLSCSTL